MSQRKKVKTTHVGSLPRPETLASLLRARHLADASFDKVAFDDAVDNAVLDCVLKQKESGIDIVSDGEMSKVSYAYYVQDRLSGLEPADVARAKYPNIRRFQQMSVEYPEYPDYMAFRAARGYGPWSTKPPVCTGPLSYRDLGAVVADISRLKAAMAKASVTSGFMTAASPGVVAMFASETSHYASEEDYVFALAEALRPEYEAIYQAGLLLQIDCPDLTLGRRMRYGTLEGDPVKIAARNIEATNHALRNISGDRVRIHICWGNYAGPHSADIEIAKLLPVIQKTRARALSFEAANPRHEHEWEDWKSAKLPDDMVLIPGVIDSVTNFVEHPRLVAQRIRHFTDAVGRERVIAGCDCGFATFSTNTPQVFPSIVWAKLKSLSEGAVIAA